MRHNGHEIPPKHGQISSYKGALADWKLALVDCACKNEIMAATTAELHNPLKGIQGGYQKSTHSVEKMDKAGLQTVIFFK